MSTLIATLFLLLVHNLVGPYRDGGPWGHTTDLSQQPGELPSWCTCAVAVTSLGSNRPANHFKESNTETPALLFSAKLVFSLLVRKISAAGYEYAHGPKSTKNKPMNASLVRHHDRIHPLFLAAMIDISLVVQHVPLVYVIVKKLIHPPYQRVSNQH